MSNTDVIHDTSLTLRTLLDTSLTLRTLLEARLKPDGVMVTVDSPHRANQPDLRVNLFLYNVVQDESRRNSGGWVAIERTDRSQKFAAEPLALRLYYLLTAFADDGLTEHSVLGKAMQVLYLNRRIADTALQGGLQSGRLRAEHMQLTQLNVDIDTLQKIWGSQTEPMRASVAYEVEAVFLDAEDEADVPIVKHRLFKTVAFPHLDIIAPEAASPGATVRLYGANLLVLGPDSDPPSKKERNLVRVWFGDAEAEVLGGSEAVMDVRVPNPPRPKPDEPESWPMQVPVRLQLDRYLGRPVSFEILKRA